MEEEIQKQSVNHHQLTLSQSNFDGRFPFVWANLKDVFELQQQQMQNIEKNLQKDSVNFGVGAMFGAFIGDALGAYCQFGDVPFGDDHPILIQAMKMPGKGTFNIKSGQFTDDSQLASHMLQALCSFDPCKEFQNQKTSILLKIAEQYAEWLRSQPFDIGATTMNALKIIKNNLYEMRCDKENGDAVDQALKLKVTFTRIELKNFNSCSNGSLMRISPMAFFISLLLQEKQNSQMTCENFRSFIMSEINMTHGNPEIFESSYAWVQLMVELILRKRKNKAVKQVFNEFVQKYKANKSIGEWVHAALSQDYMDATKNQGWARIAFTYGIKSLQTLVQINEEQLSQEHYVKIIKKVISRAGDSDTNAAIVGELIGAVLGFGKLPKVYLEKQFSLRLDQKDKECSFRGQFYQPRRQFYKALKMVENFDVSEE